MARCSRSAALALAAVLAATAIAAAAAAALPIDPASEAPPPPDPPLQKLEAMYQQMLNDTCGAVVPQLPPLPITDKDVAAFMAAYKAFNGTNSEADVMHLAGVLLARTNVQAFLGAADSFEPGGLDAAMVKCAVLVDATPLGLATFAVMGQTEQDLVAALLNDTLLMRDMLVGGGAAGGNYGQAYQILTQLHKASRVLPVSVTPPTPAAHLGAGTPWDDRNQSTILRRMALGTALGHALPIALRYKDPATPNVTTVDPVARYLHYETHYLAGDLDPALEVLTTFECRWTTNCDASDADLLWLRTTMANYRPEHIAMTDYSWRYAEAVHTDVAYGDPACATLPGICNGHYAQIPAAGGECGPRAFFGRYTRKAFGLPTWGVTQPGHAAMTTWAPDGWRVLLGADWQFSWWSHAGPSRGGEDFHLETQCRELRPEYQKVLRGGWAANALGEAPVNPSWTPRSPSTYGQGGPWSALMLYAKKIAVNATTPPPRAIGPSVVPTKVQALVDKWPQTWPAPNITTDAAGNTHIPASAFSAKNRSASITVMKSFDGVAGRNDAEQILYNSGDYVHPSAVSFSYEVTVPQACTRYLTANHTTWHMNTDLYVSTNVTTAAGKAPLLVNVFDTVGAWNETEPVALSLLAGTNVLTFSRTDTNGALGIKGFTLYVDKPNVPAPDKNHSTKPIPPPSDYIEVPDTTTCAKQGITDVPEQYCGLACEALGLKYTGAKPRTNMTGCFALVDGEWKGNCNFNSNSSAVICPDPPCQVEGSTVAQICVRK